MIISEFQCVLFFQFSRGRFKQHGSDGGWSPVRIPSRHGNPSSDQETAEDKEGRDSGWGHERCHLF